MTFAYGLPDNRRVGRPKVKSNQYNFRLAADVIAILDTVAAENAGMDRTGALEFIARDYAERKGIKPAPRLPGGGDLTADPRTPYETAPTTTETSDGSSSGDH